MKYRSVVALTFASIALMAAAQTYAAEKAGKVILSKGAVTADNIAGDSRELRRGKPIFEGDTITTGPSSLLQINMLDNGMIALAENSIFSVNNYQGARAGEEGKESVILDIVQGGFRAVTGEIGKNNPQSVKVRTGVASIGIRGTGYELFIYDGAMYISMLSGTINIVNGAGSLDIGEGAEFNFARVDSNSITPIGLYSLPFKAAANNPFIAATEVVVERKAYTVPLDSLGLNTYNVEQFTSINGDENPTRLTFTPVDNTDSGSDNGGDGSSSGDSGTVATSLTSSELDSLNVSNIKSSVLLAGSDAPYRLLTGKDASGNTTFFVEEGATVSAYSQLIRQDQASSQSGYPKVTTFDDNTTWGIWLASASTPAKQYGMANGELTSTNIENTIYWITTTPAQGLEATYTFLATGAYEGDSDLGAVSALSASMRVNFDSTVVSNGFLNVTTGDTQWSTSFSGNVSVDSDGSLGGQFDLSGDNTSGLLSGYFVASDEIFFTGTYSLNNTSNNFARGLLAMEGYETILVYGGNDPGLEQFGTLVAFEGSALLHGPTVLDPLNASSIGFNTDDANGVTAGWFVEKQTSANASGYPIAKTELSANTYWGIWNASVENPGNLRYRTQDNKEYSSAIEAPIYWMSTPAMEITRTGTASFASTGDFVGSSNQGTITSLTASIDFNFDSQIVTGGQLDVTTGTTNEAWSFNFADVAQANRFIDMQNGYFSVNQTQVNASNSNGVFGRVEGYFVGDAQDGISAAFGLFRQGDSSYLDSVNGLFSMTER